jgi:hypothetical protein
MPLFNLYILAVMQMNKPIALIQLIAVTSSVLFSAIKKKKWISFRRSSDHAHFSDLKIFAVDVLLAKQII